MAGSSAGQGARRSGGVLLVWVATILIDLFVVLVIAHGADAGALVFGRSGSTIVIAVLALLPVASATCAWRGVPGAARTLLAAAQFLAAMLVLVVLFGFFAGDGSDGALLTPLLIYCAFAEAMIGTSVLTSARPVDSPRKGG